MCAYLPLPASHSNIYEAAGVCYSLLRTTLGGLLLLLGFDLHHLYISQRPSWLLSHGCNKPLWEPWNAADYAR